MLKKLSMILYCYQIKFNQIGLVFQHFCQCITTVFSSLVSQPFSKYGAHTFVHTKAFLYTQLCLQCHLPINLYVLNSYLSLQVWFKCFLPRTIYLITLVRRNVFLFITQKTFMHQRMKHACITYLVK